MHASTRSRSAEASGPWLRPGTPGRSAVLVASDPTEHSDNTKNPQDSVYSIRPSPFESTSAAGSNGPSSASLKHSRREIEREASMHHSWLWLRDGGTLPDSNLRHGGFSGPWYSAPCFLENLLKVRNLHLLLEPVLDLLLR